MIKVFLSSTSRDLQTHRDAVAAAIGKLHNFVCIRMEDFGAVDDTPASYDSARVKEADILVGLLAHNYGSSPPGDNASFTACEYDAAVAADIPRLMFITPEDFEVPDAPTETDVLRDRQQAFRARVEADRVVARFTSPPDLASDVLAALSNWVTQRHVSNYLAIPQNRYRDGISPGALLRGDYGVVPFHGREDELQGLRDWAETSDTWGVRLYTGPGGIGKTRLAVEFCKQQQDQRWLAGFLDHRHPSPPPNGISRLFGHRRDLLIVLDYAETCRDLLHEVMRGMLDRPNSRTRLLLLARGAGDWWDEILSAGDGVGELLRGKATQRAALSALALDVKDRRRSFHIAAEAFAKALGKLVPNTEPADYEASYFDRVLLLHMTALAAVDGVEVKGEDGILDVMLDRERRFWRNLAATRELPKTLTRGIERAMATITLGGGADDVREAVNIVRRLEFFHEQRSDVLHAIVELLHDSYPGDKWIEPLQPDLLGEHLVEAALDTDADELLTLVLGPEQPLT